MPDEQTSFPQGQLAPPQPQQIRIAPNPKPGSTVGPSPIQPSQRLNQQSDILSVKTGMKPPAQPQQQIPAIPQKGQNAGELGQPWNLRFNQPVK